MYTSRPDMERSGMGFTVMESFMDRVDVVSEVGKGTTVTMFKTFNSVRVEKIPRNIEQIPERIWG